MPRDCRIGGVTRQLAVAAGAVLVGAVTVLGPLSPALAHADDPPPVPATASPTDAGDSGSEVSTDDSGGNRTLTWISLGAAGLVAITAGVTVATVGPLRARRAASGTAADDEAEAADDEAEATEESDADRLAAARPASPFAASVDFADEAGGGAGAQAPARAATSEGPDGFGPDPEPPVRPRRAAETHAGDAARPRRAR